ncbi:hypothetical protein [Xanthomonas sp. NCPPB 1128]|uniref:hypothetical protein n=1 Tax=Xanthomonas sp. NCPPB 1128 TaxID=1775876 RepID=UPI000AAE16D7|nr:hypothetical protein [Xanthomonas sp. NCPPB 1128]
MAVELWGSLALCVAVALSLLGVGAGLLSLTEAGRRLHGLELLAYSVAVGVVGHGALGVFVVSLPSDNRLNACIGFALLYALSCWQWYRHGVLGKLLAGRWRLTVLGFAAWIGMALSCMAIVSMPVRFPGELPDGPYVIKNHHLHVKVQVMMGAFPADNYLPYLSSEFLLRDIQFAFERPLMPGQELSNRPILMSLVNVPFRAVLDPPAKQARALPRFSYVGQDWPDVGSLGDDDAFRQFLAVGIVLNSTLLLGAALLLMRAGLRGAYVLAGLLLVVSSPYFIAQTLFTWPKSLGGFFLILGAYTLLSRRSAFVAGVLAGMAYWSHPYAIVFAGCFGLYILLRDGFKPQCVRNVIAYGLALAACVLPWWLWTRWYLQIPSDLVAQNLLSSASLIDLIWIRVANAARTFLPMYLGTYPLVPNQLFQELLVSITGAMGVLLIAQAYAGAWIYGSRRPKELFAFVLLPCALLVGVFSAPAIPAVHGLQAIGIVLCVFAMKFMQERMNHRVALACVILQLLLNLGLLWVRARALLPSA